MNQWPQSRMLCSAGAAFFLLVLTTETLIGSRLGWRPGYKPVKNQTQPEETGLNPEASPTSSHDKSEKPNAPRGSSANVKQHRDQEGAPLLQLKLEDCIRLSLQNNLELLSRRLDPEVADAQVRAARAIFEPALSGSVQHSRQNFSPRPQEREFLGDVETSVNRLRASLSGLLPPGTSYDFSITNASVLEQPSGSRTNHSSVLRLDISQPLLRGFGSDVNLATLRLARSEMEAAVAQYEAFLSSLVRDIHDAYNDLLFFRANLAVRNEDLELAEQLLADNRARNDAGSMAALDVTQANAAVFARRVDLLRAERLLINAENALKRLLFTDITPYLETRIIPAEVPAPSTVYDPAKNRLTALSRRPEIRAAEARIRQSHIRLGAAKNDMLPQLDITAGYQHQGRDNDFWTSLRDALDGYETGWNVGLILNIPLGFASESANRDIAAVRLRQSKLALDALRQDILLQVETSVGNVETARLANAAAREARIFSRQSLDAETELLKNGASTTFQVSQLQRELSEARINELRTVLDWNRALAALAQAEGTILERFGVRVVFDTPAEKSEKKK